MHSITTGAVLGAGHHFSDSIFPSSNGTNDKLRGSIRCAVGGEAYSQTLRGTAHISGHFEFPDVARKALEFLLEVGDLDPLLFQRHIPLLDGQYGIAVTNHQSGSVHLIADLFGTVPIYYAQVDGGWVWSFRLRDLLPHLPSRKIDPEGFLEIFLYRWLMGERTLLSGVRQVLPGECVTLQPGKSPQRSIYRRFDFTPNNGAFDQAGLVEQTSQALDRYFGSVRQRYDRIAILFSGGVDSSLLLAKAKEHNFRRLVAVTVRYPGHDNPELERALQIARHLGVQPLLVDVDDDFVKPRFDDPVRVLERPPTYLNGWSRTRIFEAIRGDVDAALTGEGADCLFGSDEVAGLNRFNQKQLVLRHIPWSVRRVLSQAFQKIPNSLAQRLSRQLAFSTIDLIRRGGSFEAGHKTREIGVTDLVPELRAYFGNGLPSMYEEFEPGSPASFISLAQNRTLYTSNRNQLFVYASHASESGIPVLHPFLSQVMLEIGKTLPDAAKRDAEGAKPILKKLACRYVPRELIYGRKYDFRAPVGWLEGPLAPWLEILKDGATGARGVFDTAVSNRLAADSNRSLIITAATVEIFFRQFVDV